MTRIVQVSLFRVAFFLAAFFIPSCWAAASHPQQVATTLSFDSWDPLEDLLEDPWERDYGLLGNALEALVNECWFTDQSSAAPETTPCMETSGSRPGSCHASDDGASPGSLVNKTKDPQRTLKGSYLLPSFKKTKPAPTIIQPEVVVGPLVSEEPEEGFVEPEEASQGEGLLDMDFDDLKTRLKHLVEPFILKIVVDDGGLQVAAQRLRGEFITLETGEAIGSNKHFVGGGVAAL